MPRTLAEKIIARASGRDQVNAGDEVWARADRMIMNDSSGPRRIAGLIEELGGVLDPDRIVLASDHFTPASTPRHVEILNLTREWAAEKRLTSFFESNGILHNLVLEKGLVKPGMLLVGADSHTCTAGAAGALAVAVGSTELATVLATGEVWLRVPESIRIDLNGALVDGVDLRDVTMRVLDDFGTERANYRSVELGGSFVDTLALEDRLVLANQGIEMGAKNAIVEPSELHPDPGASYVERRTYDVDELAPLVACHPSPDNVVAAAEITDLEVDTVWIGSCVGGRLADLRAAARVLTGRSVRVRTSVTPATHEIHRAAITDGTLQTLVDAGCVVQPPGCGACAGIHGGIAGDGEIIFSTGTRNFPGRMGSRSAQIYLGSGYTAGATAATGRVSDPRELL